MTELTFKKSTPREYFESLVITVILALFGTTFIVQAFKIPTPSMEDNLLVGDHLLVNKFVFGARGSILDSVLPFKNIKRGDVIVFKYPKDLSKHYVKRAIGIPSRRSRIRGGSTEASTRIRIGTKITPRMAKSLCHRATILRWGTIAITAPTAVIGDSSRAN